MKQVAAGVFKAKCLAMMDEVRETGEPYVITKRGLPVAQLVPVKPETNRRKSVFGCMKDEMQIVGDIDVSPWTEAYGDRDPIVEKWDRLDKMILLDTQCWIRLAADETRISRRAAAAIRRAERGAAMSVSVVSVWEACWLRRRGRIRALRPLRDWVAELRTATTVELIALSPEICVVAAELPDSIPFDPGDRLIVATALSLGCPLVTSDERIRTSGCVETIW